MTQITITKVVELPKSTLLDHAEYCTNDGTLDVTFNNGRTYRYHEVPEDVIREWLKAASAGSYFHENIRDNYKYKDITP